MLSIFTRCVLVGLLLGAIIGDTYAIHAQTFGLELHNHLMPASGGPVRGMILGHPFRARNSSNHLEAS